VGDGRNTDDLQVTQITACVSRQLMHNSCSTQFSSAPAWAAADSRQPPRDV